MKFNPQPKPTPSGKKPKKPLKRSAIKYKRKKTGELDLFKEIWSERPHACSCCNSPLGNELQPIFFSHLLAKSTYPKYRLDKRNIWLKCPTCHTQWETGDRSQPKFKKASEEAFKLKQEYYSKKLL